jgi:hypothetical protein
VSSVSSLAGNRSLGSGIGDAFGLLTGIASMSRMSRCSREMLEHYSHVRLEVKRKALELLSMQNAESENESDSYDTNHDTKPTSSVSEQDASCWKDWSALTDDFRTFL